MDYNNKSYIVLATSELDQINFDEVYETSTNTVKLSVNGLKTFVKYSNDMPTSISSLTTKEGPYTHEQILTILETPEWKSMVVSGSL
jgi:Cdc6-like AAA superfamily ATPase